MSLGWAFAYFKRWISGGVVEVAGEGSWGRDRAGPAGIRAAEEKKTRPLEPGARLWEMA